MADCKVACLFVSMCLVHGASGIHPQSGSDSKRRRCSRAGSLVPYTRRVGLPTLLEGFSTVKTFYLEYISQNCG